MEELEFAVDSSISKIPHLTEYFGIWAMEERAFLSAAQWARSLDLRLHQEQYARDGGSSGISESFSRVEGLPNIAVVSLHGTLMKQEVSGQRSTSTVEARRLIRAAARDETVDAILLHIDSPGGTVSGTADLGDDIAGVGGKKPVIAFIEDLGASAAYWAASQADQVFMNRSGQAGSIGTFGVVHDLSAAAAMQGVKVHVVRAGEYKGAGVPGTEITDKQLAEAQRIINDLNEQFLHAVADGRGMSMSTVRALADGRTHVGESAVELGLVDGISSLDSVIANLAARCNPPTRRPRMAQNSATTTGTAQEGATLEVTAPAAASFKDLKAGLPGADDSFICSQLDAEATVEQATKAWMVEQQNRIEAANKKAVEAEKNAAKKSEGHNDVDLAGAAADAANQGGEDFQAKVQGHCAKGMKHFDAVKRARKEDPEGYVSWIAGHNIANRRKKGADAFIEREQELASLES